MMRALSRKYPKRLTNSEPDDDQGGLGQARVREARRRILPRSEADGGTSHRQGQGSSDSGGDCKTDRVWFLQCPYAPPAGGPQSADRHSIDAQGEKVGQL